MITWYGSEQDAVEAAEKSVSNASGVHAVTICKAIKSVTMKSKAVWEEKSNIAGDNVTRIDEKRQF